MDDPLVQHVLCYAAVKFSHKLYNVHQCLTFPLIWLCCLVAGKGRLSCIWPRFCIHIDCALHYGVA